MDDDLWARVALSCGPGGLVAGEPGEDLPAAAARVAGPEYASSARRVARRWQETGGWLLVPGPTWPPGLDDLGRWQPLVLWGWGRRLDPDARSVAIVGARRCTGYGRTATGLLAGAAVSAGATVVSGGAVGIDAQAHRTALASSGPTVLLAAGGAGTVYPPANEDLFEQCRRRGTVCWEYGPGTAMTRAGFLHRNRLIAALSSTVVVVEAAERSGALNTARTAADLGRLVLAVPGPITSRMSAGSHRAVCEGWAALVAGPEDLTDLLPGAAV